MSIKRLEMIVIPPEKPTEVPEDYEWNDVELKLTPLPSDYHEFINRYGTGSLDSFIWIFNPSSLNPNLQLCKQVDRQLDVLREINDSEFESPIVLFPDQSGLLPLGITDNGDVLLWETIGEANDWTIAVLPSRGSTVIRFSMNMTDFLAGLLEGSIHCEVFPVDFPSSTPIFTSA
jgi:hypothetical protein